MSLQFDSEQRPFIQLDDGYTIECHGEAPQEHLTQRGETPKFLQDRCQKVLQLCREAGPDYSRAEFLVQSALRNSSYDVAEATRTLIFVDNLMEQYKLRGNVDTLRHVFEQGLVWYLPRRCKDGSVGVVMEAGKIWDPSKVPLLDLCAAFRFAQQAMLMDERTHFSCMKLIINYDGMTLKHCAQYKPKILKLIMEVQHVTMTDKQIHHVNCNKFFNAIFEASKSWIDKKIKDQIFCHGTNFASFHQYVDRECLPANFGGTAQDYDHRLVGELLISMKDKLYESRFS